MSANESHYSNEKESIKFLEEIILPYIRQEGEKLGRENQKTLLIFDVFRGQTTDKVLKIMEDNNILATKVPPNMTNLYQPLDLAVSKAAKDFTRKKFSGWYIRQLTNGVVLGSHCGSGKLVFEHYKKFISIWVDSTNIESLSSGISSRELDDEHQEFFADLDVQEDNNNEHVDNNQDESDSAPDVDPGNSLNRIT